MMPQYAFAPSYKPTRNCHGLKLCDLSRNVLIIICEYLSFFQMVTLTGTNKRIKAKLDNFLEPAQEVSYFKRRAIINFQSFFFEQFPSSEVYFQRMSQITGTSEQTYSSPSFGLGMCSQIGSTANTYQSFLPLTKQSSLCLYSQKNLPFLKKQPSLACPFELAREEHSRRENRKQLLEKYDDDKSSNYIDETYKIWKSTFLKALENKTNFVEQAYSEFFSIFSQHPDDFAKEIFLDPSFSENPAFPLPSLQREDYAKKGQFYRTEKILVQSHQHCFFKYSVDATK